MVLTSDTADCGKERLQSRLKEGLSSGSGPAMTPKEINKHAQHIHALRDRIVESRAAAIDGIKSGVTSDLY